jgi:hypothetical protein
VRRHFYLGVFAVVALVCVALAQTGSGHSVLRTAGLYEEPPSYTELAFSTPSALPGTLPKSGASVTVSFGIHNVSATPRTYAWSIALVRSGKSQVKATGAVPASAQGRVTVSRSVAVACPAGRVQVVVRLASPAQSVNFWLTCPPAAAKKQAAR